MALQMQHIGSDDTIAEKSVGGRLSYFLAPGIPLKLSLSNIIRIVCEYTGYSLEELKSKSRKRELVFARMLIFYNARHHLRRTTLKTIGEPFNRDHATVLHGVKTISDLMDVDKEVRKDVQAIQSSLIKYKQI